MAKMIVLYGQAEDLAAVEDYYASGPIPHAAEQMPTVTGAENLPMIGTPGGEAPRYYRISQMSYASAGALREALATGGKAVLADLGNFATGSATVLLIDE